MEVLWIWLVLRRTVFCCENLKIRCYQYFNGVSTRTHNAPISPSFGGVILFLCFVVFMFFWLHFLYYFKVRQGGWGEPPQWVVVCCL